MKSSTEPQVTQLDDYQQCEIRAAIEETITHEIEHDSGATQRDEYQPSEIPSDL